MNDRIARLLPRPSAWFYGIVSAFIALNSWLLTQEFFILPLIPVVVLILFAALVSIDKLVYFILFFTPFSLTVEFSEFAALTLPTEPLLFGVMLVFLFKLLFEGGFDRRITRHPVTIAIVLMLIWMILTSLTSTIKVDNATDVMAGFAVQSQDAGATLQMFETAASPDTITFDDATGAPTSVIPAVRVPSALIPRAVDTAVRSLGTLALLKESFLWLTALVQWAVAALSW